MIPPSIENAWNSSADWSPVNRLLLDAATRDPQWTAEESFASIRGDNPFKLYELQSWPLFASVAKMREVERVTVGMDRLLRSVMERFLNNDPRRIDQMYQVGSEDFVTLILAHPNGVDGAMSRGDYIETPDGLVCLEYNAGSHIGGWQTQFLEGLYTRCPLIARFLAENRIRARHRTTVQALFQHLIRDTVQKGIWRRGSFNLALVTKPNNPGQASLHRPELYDPEFEKAIARVLPGVDGGVRLCGYEDMELTPGGPRLAGEPVHAILEQHAGFADRQVLRSFKAGRVNLFSGLVSRLLSDKRGLALLSERASSSDLTAPERDLVERHLPWTRRLLRVNAERRGRSVFLPDHVLEHRAELVLKKGVSLNGRDVHIGAYRSPEEWLRLVRAAVAEGDWIVQDLVAGRPFAFKDRDGGMGAHHVVWGLLVFGGELGGTYVRLHPFGRRSPVNTTFGAEVAILLETEEP